ncbi:MAG: hypothetical protein CV087_23120 [Candidatus Brocadia sp. WS118]|nr:MAG: hypothetical protein CV087_23120 [Candidatus Brocadia sp. WS118]
MTIHKVVEYLRNNLFGVLGLVVGLIGIYLAIYFKLQSVEIREPIYYRGADWVIINRGPGFIESPFKIIRSDGNEIKNDIYLTKIYFWNNGKKPIRKENILDGLNITLEDSVGTFLDYKILKTSRDIINFQVISDSLNPQKKINFSFDILEQFDGACIQLWIESIGYKDIKINGIIEGSSLIKRSVISPNFFNYYPIFDIFPFFAITVLMFAIFIFYRTLKFNRTVAISDDLNKKMSFINMQQKISFTLLIIYLLLYLLYSIPRDFGYYNLGFFDWKPNIEIPDTIKDDLFY